MPRGIEIPMLAARALAPRPMGSRLKALPLTDADTTRIALQVTRDIVVATIQVDLDEDVLTHFQEDLLHRVQKTGAHGVILDISGLEVLDREEFEALRRVILMAKLMGADSVLVGVRPGIAAALIEAGADVDDLKAASDLDAAVDLLTPEPEPRSEEVEDEESTTPEDDVAEPPAGDEA